MKLSARNQFPATVRSMTEGTVMAEITVEIDGGHELVSAITAQSAQRLGLAPGKRRDRHHQVDGGHPRDRRLNDLGAGSTSCANLG